ncbi:MAG: hypothetical protein ACUVX8_08485 [Candidatus Zipacnadales bacterium]
MPAYKLPIMAALFTALSASPSSALIWHTLEVDELGSVGTFSSLDLDSKDEPHIAYYDATNGDLKYAWRKNGKAWSHMTVDATGDVGQWCALALDKNDVAHLSYYDATNKLLKYAKGTPDAWETAIIHKDSNDTVGQHTSIAVDGAGRPHIAYHHASDGRLYYIAWTGTQWDRALVDTGDVGQYTSLALTPSGTPHISYYDARSRALRHAYKAGALWRDEEVDSAGDVGKFSSLALTNFGRPWISYYDATNGNLKVAWFDGSSWANMVVDSLGDVGAGTSIGLDDSGRPHIAYFDATNQDLKYARWNGSSWEIEVTDASGSVGRFCSMKLDTQQLPHIAYANTKAGDLKFTTPSGAWFFFLPDKHYADGVRPNTGIANDTRFKFRVVYQDAAGWPPVRPVVIVSRNGVQYAVRPLRAAETSPIYGIGVEMRTALRLPEGTYTYRFRARNQAGLFAGGEPNEEHGPLVVRSGSGSGPVLTSIVAVPTHGGLELTLTLARPASVEVKLLNIAGRPIKSLVANRKLEQGIHTLVWTGLTDAGLHAPAGVYMALVVAHTPDGGQDRVVRQVTLQPPRG